MAFVSPDLAETLNISSADATDAGVSTEANLNDDNTSTEASGEIRNGMSCYKITHDIGFDVANIDTLSVRCFDGSFMDTGDTIVYPYSSGDVDVVTGNQQALAINDNGAYDTLVMSSSFIADLQDVGTQQISIRFAYDNVIRGRFTEIQIDVVEAAGGEALVEVDDDDETVVEASETHLKLTSVIDKILSLGENTVFKRETVGAALTEILDEIVQTLEDTTTIKAIGGAVIDKLVEIEEAIEPHLDLSRVLTTEIADIIEATNTALVMAREDADDETIVEALNTLKVIGPRVIDKVEDIVEEVIRKLFLLLTEVVATEVENIVEGVEQHRAITSVKDEIEQLIETVTAHRVMARVLPTEVANIVEALNTARVMVREDGDIVDIVEALNSVKAIGGVIVDADEQIPESIVDVLALGGATLVEVLATEVENLVEAVEQHRAIAAVKDEVTQLIEELETHRVMARPVDVEDVTILDAAEAHLVLTTVVDETVQLLETAISLLTLIPVVDEVETVEETTEAHLFQAIRGFVDETISMGAETIVTLLTILSEISEDETVVEGTEAHLTLTRVVDELTQIIDVAESHLTMTRVEDETTEILETLIRIIISSNPIEVLTELEEIPEAVLSLITDVSFPPIPTPIFAPAIVGLTRTFVTPETWRERIANLADDGSNYEVIFETGLYDISTDFEVVHVNGGQLIFRSFQEHLAVFKGAPGGNNFAMVAERMGFHDFHILGVPFTDSHTTNRLNTKLRFTGTRSTAVVSTQPYVNIVPREIHITNLKLEGDDAAFTIQPSNNPTIYTDVFIGGCNSIDGGQSLIQSAQEFTSFGITSEVFAHIHLDGNKSFNRNAPLQPQAPNNGVHGDGPAWGGETASHHSDNTMFIVPTGLAGHSTYLEVGSDFTSELWGSNNHDMHCERVGSIRSKDVVMRWKDCKFKGNWRAGHVGGEGGGNLWVWYYHIGGPDYPSSNDDDRPLLEFENCLFRQTIYPGVPHEDIAATLGFGTGTAHCQSSGTYHFFDCRFEVIDDGGVYNSRQAHVGNPAIGLNVSCGDPQPAVNHHVLTHNCKFILPTATTHPTEEIHVNFPCVSSISTVDDATRIFGPTDFARTFGLVRTPDEGFEYLFSSPSFETDDPAWVLGNIPPTRENSGFPSPMFLSGDDWAMKFVGDEDAGTFASLERVFPAFEEFLTKDVTFYFQFFINGVNARSQGGANEISFRIRTAFDAGPLVELDSFIGDDFQFGWHHRRYAITPSATATSLKVNFDLVIAAGAPGTNLVDYWLDLVQFFVEVPPT